MPRHKNSTGHNGFLEQVKSGKYRGTITVANKKYRKVFTANERESQKLLREWAKDMVETKGKKRNGVEKTKADEILKTFEALYKTKRNIGEKTHSYYVTDIKLLVDWMNWKGHVTYLEDLTEKDVANFVHDKLDGKKSARTAQLKIFRLGFVFRLICGKSIPSPFSDVNLKGISEGKKPYKYALLTDDEIIRLVKAAKEFKTKNGFDFYGYYLIGIYTGLRSCDASTLTFSSIDFKERVITLIPKKTSRMEKEVVIPIHPVLFHYLTERRKVIKTNNLFPECSTKMQIYNNAIFKNAGISQEIFVGDDGKKYKKSFHSFRVTMASKLGYSGCPLPVAISIMGHSVTMFLHYFRRDNDVAKSFVNKAWSGVNLTGFGNTDNNNEEEE